jgi:hypothetical protein
MYKVYMVNNLVLFTVSIIESFRLVEKLKISGELGSLWNLIGIYYVLY